MTKIIAVKLKPSAERLVKKGHPWVFSDSIQKINFDGNTGDIVVLFDHRKNKPYAVGLFDIDSPIRIKVIHHNSGVKVNQDFFELKINKAFVIRKPLLGTNTNAYRFIFGENDGFPGMIIDVYNNVGVLKLYSAIWFPYLEMIIPKVVELSRVGALVLRLSRNLQNQTTRQEGEVLFGELKSSEVIFKEYGVQFKVDVLLGHKTGFFLDHRANRHKIGQLAKGKTVLDVFSYAGGFSVHALVGGAKEVTSLDFSKQALELALENSKLNEHIGKHTVIDGDAFLLLEEMKNHGKEFDIVVIDPPSFANSQRQRSVAKKKYAQLAELGIGLTKNEGILLLASCSSRITADELRQIHVEEFHRLGVVNCELLEFMQHDIDHPIGFEEGVYLKSFYYRVFK